MSKAALWNASPGCAAFSGVQIFILWQCFVRLQSRPVADVGCWWMVSVDGALHGVVWYSCWQVYGTETASLLERMLYFYILLLGLLWLATSWFVSGGCACYLSFLFLSLGGSEYLKQEGAEGAERLHPYRQTNKECHWRWKQPANTCLQADENNLPHMLASKSSQTQDSRQQRATTRKRRIRSKITDEYCSKNRWMEIDIEQRRASEEANQNKTDAETFLQQTQDQSQRRLILSYVFFSNSAGARRGRIGQGNALWNARPTMRRYLQRVNCHFIRALCAPSVSSCGSCKMVMDGGHLHAVISSFPEIFVEGPLARSMLVSYSAMGCRAHCASLRCVL